MRSRICEGLAFLGLGIDEAQNMSNSSVISVDRSPVTVRVIPNNEEVMIAKAVYHLSKLTPTHVSSTDGG